MLSENAWLRPITSSGFFNRLDGPRQNFDQEMNEGMRYDFSGEELNCLVIAYNYRR